MTALVHFIQIEYLLRFIKTRDQVIIEVIMDPQDHIDDIIERAKVKLNQYGIKIDPTEINVTIL